MLFDILVGQNVHLVARWLPSLDAFLEAAAVDSHPKYRVFITGEPAPSPEQHVIPRGILENAIKITKEPPTGMNASLHAALHNFSQVRLKCKKVISMKASHFINKMYLISCSFPPSLFRILWICAPESRSSTPCSSPSVSFMLV